MRYGNPLTHFCRRTTGWHTGLRHTRFGRNPRKAAQGILSALRTGRANPTSWKCRNSSLWSFGRWSAGTGIFSNGTSGTGSLTRYGTKPFTDGRCVCLRALMNAWLRKNGMKRSIRRLGAFQRYKGGVSCSTTSMSSILPNRRYGALHRFGNTEICCDCKGESKGGN